jgi:uncharacterized delta-60 repeat protein
MHRHLAWGLILSELALSASCIRALSSNQSAGDDAAVQPPFALSTASPKALPIGATTQLRVSGTGFEAGISIRVGKQPCTELRLLSETELTCTTTQTAVGPVSLTGSLGDTERSATLSTEILVFEPATLDATFGDQGISRTDVAGDDDFLWDRVLLLPDDSILVVGDFTSDGLRRPLLARYTPDGELDETFGSAGLVRAPVPPGLQQAWFCDHQLTSSGQIVAVGNGLDANENVLTHISRFSPDGQLDTSFADDGAWVLQIGDRVDHSCQIELGDADAIYVGGHMDKGVDFELQLLRLDADGRLDTTYGVDGRFRIDPGGKELSFDFALRPNGSAILALAETPRLRLVGVTPDGTLDVQFGTQGFVTLPSGSSAAGINRLRIVDDGSLIVAGQSQESAGTTGYDAACWRVLPGGELDTSFGEDGLVLVDADRATEMAYDALRLSDGRIFAVGDSRGVRQQALIMALTATGAADTSFRGGSFVLDVDDGLDRLLAIAQDSFGRLVAAGQSDRNGNRDLLLLRFWP